MFTPARRRGSLAATGLCLLLTAAPAAAATGAVPGAPTSVTATAGNGTVALAWKPPTSTGGSPLTGYTASCVSGTSSPHSATVAATVLTATISGLTNGSAYTCKVAATNAVGTGAAASAAAAVTPVGAPGAPGSVLATTSGTGLVVTWSTPSSGGSPITGYAVTCTSTDGGATLTAKPAATATSASLTGLTADKTYRCAVTASNAKGTSSSAASADYAMHAVSSATTPTVTLHLPVTSGQRATFEGSNSTVTSTACEAVTVKAVSGSTLVQGCLFKGETDHVATTATFPASGTATVTWAPPTGSSGTAELRVYAFTDVTGTISAGGSAVTARVSAPGQAVSLSFAGSAGQVVSMTALSSTIAGELDLYNAAGSDLRFTSFSVGQDGLLDQTTLSTTGTYTVKLRPSGWSTGSTSLRLYTVPASTGSITLGGASVTATASVPGQNPTRTFTVTAGQKVVVSYSANTLTGLLDVRSAGGSELGYAYLAKGTASGSFTATLPSAGTYTVLVDPSSDHTGSVVLSLHS